MPGCRDLREFLQWAKEGGELRVVAAEVDPNLEVSAITDRVCKRTGGGEALLFPKVLGHPFALATNLFGSEKRIAAALGSPDLDDLAMRFRREIPETGSDAERLQKFCIAPYRVEMGGSREVVEEVGSLDTLPALRNWPGDAGRFLTLPLVFTCDPHSGRANCGMYRVQILGGQKAAIRWREGSGGEVHFRQWCDRGERMPVAIVLGGPPALTWAATAPLPPGIDESAFAGGLQGEPLESVRCLTCDLEVPASAEFVLEGYVQAGESLPEGPFGNHTGFYAPPAPAPVFHLERLCRRSDPILPCTVVGPPPMENLWFARATEALVVALLKREFPEIVRMHFLAEGAFHGCTLVFLRSEGRGRGGEIIRRLWRTPYLAGARLLVTVDAALDPTERSLILWRLINQVDPGRDLIVEGGRLGIDGTAVREGEPVVPDPEIVRKVQARWAEYGID